jgi:hypothetical protein
MRELLIKIHEIWLETLMSAMMSKDTENKRTLYEFSDIFFRHFRWIENELIEKNIDYDYDRNSIPIKVENLKVILSDIIRRVNEIELLLVECEDKTLRSRVSTDLDYISYRLRLLKDEDVKSAFDVNRKYKNIELDKEATDSLTLFLFEESYKEYELIMVYNYLKAHCKDSFLIRIFDILIEESFFHLRSFGEMMAQMGILGVPRVIHQSLYKVEDIKQFLIDGIEEEIMAKEECLKLSQAVSSKSEELAKFFDFINYQENYHIELMRDAVKYYSQKEKDV